MTLKKKILGLILILVLTLVACSGNNETNPTLGELIKETGETTTPEPTTTDAPEATATPEPTTTTTPEPTKEPEPIVFTVKDGDGEPVAGVYIQVCTGDVCNSITTDEDGRASFAGDADEYEARIYRAPEDVTFPEDEQTVRPGDTVELTVARGGADEPATETGTTGPIETADKDDSYRIVFESVDHDGKKASSDMFGDYKLTFINRWEPWCGPCVSEMADIQALYEKYEPLGVNFIGVYNDEDWFDDVIKETGAQYQMIKDCKGFSQISNIGYVPVTIIVDKDGYMLPMRDLADSLTGEFDKNDPLYERTHVGSVPGSSYEAVIKYYLGE